MTHPVTIENEAIAMEVYPQTGGKVASIIDKADGFELLFSYPTELPETSQYDIPYARSWYAGWDECFPAVAASKYIGHPYDQISVPDHGELWGLPTMAVPTKNGITTVWHGLRFGYRLTRKLFLDGPTITADYTLVNLAPFSMRFVWGQNPLMSMIQPVKLDVGGDARFRLDGTEGKFIWQGGLGDLNFAEPATLPVNQSWKLHSTEPITRPFTVHYPTRNRTIAMEYSSEDNLQAYWGIWLNTGGWVHHHHFAVGPTTGRHDALDASQKDGSAGMVEASGRRDWSVKWTLS
jgi:hypothetical protein